MEIKKNLTAGAAVTALVLSSIGLITDQVKPSPITYEDAPGEVEIIGDVNGDEQAATDTYLFLYEYVETDTIGGGPLPQIVYQVDRTSFFRFKWERGKPINIKKVLEANLPKERIDNLTRLAIHP